MWTHRFRHDYAYRIANDPEVPILLAAELMNHWDPRQTMAYAKGRDRLRRRAAASVDR